MPTTYSAAAVASAVSRVLRRAGFKMADTSDRYHWTEGFHVSRVGVSSSVRVAYHHPDSMHGLNEARAQALALARQKDAEMRDFLEKRGYPLDDLGWIKCERE